MTQNAAENTHPIDIQVVFPGGKIDPVRDGYIPNQTSLFRGDSFLHEVLALTYETTGKSSDLTFVSAGSSIGAEADTILALHNQNVADRGATLRGFDTSYICTNKARRGAYALTPRISGAQLGITLMHDEAEHIREYGFRTEFVSAGWLCDKVFDTAGHYLIDSSDVREGHDVRFQVADLTEIAPLDGKADMIVANNVLYHQTPRRATKFVEKLGEMLGNKGVLSLGSVSDTMQKQVMRGNNPAESMTYGRWLGGTVKMLETEFGLEYRTMNKPRELPGRYSDLALFVRS